MQKELMYIKPLFPTLVRKNQRLDNSIMPNAILDAGVDEQVPYDKEAINLYDVVPFKVARTVKNTRYASYYPFIRGVLTNLIAKINSEWKICGDNQKAVEHIQEMCEEWEFTEWIDETVEGYFTDPDQYLYTWFENGHVQFNYLYYDGEDYQIKELYDEKCNLTGIKQRAVKNVITNRGWRKRLFKDLNPELEYFEQDFEVAEIIIIRSNPKGGRGRALLTNVLDLVYYHASIISMMPTTIYKNSNILKITMGNELQPGLQLSKGDKEKIIDAANNYNRKGALTLPYGITADMIQGGSLPDTPSFLKYLESLMYIALNIPEATFSSESSNRATADIQLDSPTTGQVLYLDYIRDWVSRQAKKIFRLELDENGFKNAEVWVEFKQAVNPEEEVTDTTTDETNRPNTTTKPIQKKGQDYNTRNPTQKQNTSNQDKIGGQIGGNGSTNN